MNWCKRGKSISRLFFEDNNYNQINNYLNLQNTILVLFYTENYLQSLNSVKTNSFVSTVIKFHRQKYFCIYFVKFVLNFEIIF